MNWFPFFTFWALLAAPFLAFFAYLVFKTATAERKTPFLAGYSLLGLTGYCLLQLLRYRFGDSTPILEAAIPLTSSAACFAFLFAFAHEGCLIGGLGRQAARTIPAIAAAAFTLAAAGLLAIHRLDFAAYAADLRLLADIASVGIVVIGLGLIVPHVFSAARHEKGRRLKLSWVLVPLAGLAGLGLDRWITPSGPSWNLGGLLAMQAALWIGLVQGYKPRLPKLSPDQFAERYALTSKERELLVQLSDGKTNKEIAATLGISEGAVKKRVRAVFRKTSVVNRHQLLGRMGED